VPEVSYTVRDLEALLAEYTGDPQFAGRFFVRYVYGRDVPEFGALLARAGLLLRPMAPGAAFLGTVPLAYDAEGATVTAATESGSPLHDAGLDRGDVILRLDGSPLRSDGDWRQIVERHRPGDEIEMVYRQRGHMHTVAVTAAVDPRLEIVPFEEAGWPVTDAVRAFRTAWLGAR
jgi:predicted metalloprotease with PDZ domain